MSAFAGIGKAKSLKTLLRSSVQRKVKQNPISSFHAKTAYISISAEPTIKQRYGYINPLRNNDVPSPVGHGLSLVNDGAQERLVIDWKSGILATRAVIDLISCMCKKACNNDSYDCIR